MSVGSEVGGRLLSCSSSRSLTRLWSRSSPGIRFMGRFGWGWKTYFWCDLHDFWQKDSDSCWVSGVPTGLLKCPRDTEIGFPRTSDPRHKGGRHSAIYDVELEVLCCHAHTILPVTWFRPIPRGRAPLPGLNYWKVAVTENHHGFGYNFSHQCFIVFSI